MYNDAYLQNLVSKVKLLKVAYNNKNVNRLSTEAAAVDALSQFHHKYQTSYLLLIYLIYFRMLRTDDFSH